MQYKIDLELVADHLTRDCEYQRARVGYQGGDTKEYQQLKHNLY